MSLFYSNPPDRRVGIFTIPYESIDAVTQLNCLHFGGFFAGNFFSNFTTDI